MTENITPFPVLSQSSDQLRSNIFETISLDTFLPLSLKKREIAFDRP